MILYCRAELQWNLKRFGEVFIDLVYQSLATSQVEMRVLGVTLKGLVWNNMQMNTITLAGLRIEHAQLYS